PFEFYQADALEILDHGRALGHMPRLPEQFDAIHASPPCQDHSQLHRNYGAPLHGTAGLVAATLERLWPLRLPWVVENVVGAPLASAVELCGASFGLGAGGMDL